MHGTAGCRVRPRTTIARPPPLMRSVRPLHKPCASNTHCYSRVRWVLLPVVYLFGVGPVWALANHGHIPASFRQAYFTAACLHQRSILGGDRESLDSVLRGQSRRRTDTPEKKEMSSYWDTTRENGSDDDSAAYRPLSPCDQEEKANASPNCSGSV